MDAIKELGLQIRTVFLPCGAEDVVTVKDIRAAIEKLPVVYGILDQNGVMTIGSTKEAGSDTHKARLIGVEKLVKEPVKLEKVIAYPNNFTCYAINGEEFGSKLAGKKLRLLLKR